MYRPTLLGLILSLLLLLPSGGAFAQDDVVVQNSETDYDWGWGFGLLGPSPFVDVQFHWFPTQWLGVDAGGIVLAGAGVTGHAGVRVRPFEFGDIRPFVGASATGVVALGACGAPVDDGTQQETGEQETGEEGCGSRGSSFAGPRVGLELELDRANMLLGVEADAFFSLSNSEVLYSDGDGVTWWGGAYFLWLY